MDWGRLDCLKKTRDISYMQVIDQYNLKVLQYNTHYPIQYLPKNLLQYILLKSQCFSKNVLQYNTQCNSYCHTCAKGNRIRRGTYM